MKTLSNSAGLQPLINILHRYHFVIFVVVAIGGIAVAVFMLYSVYISSFPSSDADVLPTSSFDQATIDRINKLKTPDQTAEPLNLSGRRLNPFTEG